MLLLSVVPASVARSGAESQRPPAQVELSLSFTIDRTTTECNLAVPPTISGTMLLSIDFVAGTVVGSLEGEGSGEQGIPSSCTGRDGTDIYRASTTFSGTITRDAEDPLVGGLLEGFVDATTGEFVAHAIIDIEGSGSHGIPGLQYSCPGVSGMQSECPIGEAVSPQPATISGRIQTGQEPVVEIDWYTNFCAVVSPDGVVFGRTGCPTLGSSHDVGVLSSTPAANADPVITDMRHDPLNPVVGEAVTLVAVATDADGDPLGYEWSGGGLAATGAEVSWQADRAGDIVLTVVVADGMGGTASDVMTVPVFEQQPAEEADAEEANGVEPDDDTGVFDPGVDDAAAPGVRPDEPTDVAGSDEAQGAPSVEAAAEDDGLPIPAIVVMLVALLLLAGALGLALALGSFGKALELARRIVWIPERAHVSTTPPAELLGRSTGQTAVPSRNVSLVDAEGRPIATLVSGTSYPVGGTVSGWTQVELPDGTKGWTRDDNLAFSIEPVPGTPPGLPHETPLATVDLPGSTQGYDVTGRVKTDPVPAGRYLTTGVGEDGFTSLFNPDGTDAGTISNVDNPTLHRTRYWRRFNVLVPAGGQNFDLQPLPAGTYLTGPKTPAGTPVYHPESGRYLGLRT